MSSEALTASPIQASLKKQRPCIPLWNADGIKILRHITPLQADQLEAKGDAFDTSRWIHGKGRTQRSIQLRKPERAQRTSPSGITKNECEINAGVYEAHERKRFDAIRSKVAEWENLTQEFRAAITRKAELLKSEVLNADHLDFDYKISGQ